MVFPAAKPGSAGVEEHSDRGAADRYVPSEHVIVAIDLISKFF